MPKIHKSLHKDLLSDPIHQRAHQKQKISGPILRFADRKSVSNLTISKKLNLAIIDSNPLKAIIFLNCYNLGVLDYLGKEGILSFSLVIKDWQENFRLNRHIKSIF
jgi:hypothetical protein